jgi:alpha-L-fucosidase
MQTDWFKGAGLGLFIHWDHASQQGLEISWPMVGYNSDGTQMNRPITIEQYNSSAETFDPINWNARELAELARDCGFRYAVFTTKHHTGYCMFHTKLTDFSIENSPYGRDLVREFVDAFREAGL